MGKFDLDDLLKDLTDSEPEGTERGESGGGSPPEPGAGPADADAEAPVEPPAAAAPMFVRNDPRDTPRPPDVGGTGLGRPAAVTASAVEDDATRVRPDDALSAIYRPGDPNTPVRRDDVGRLLLERGIVTTEALATAQRVMKQSPGRRLSEILIEAGADDVAVQEAVAQLARLPCVRVDPEDATTFDAAGVEKLTAEYCQANNVLPLRRDRSRLVVGTVSPSDVFVLDDVKRRLGVPAIKHVLVTASDVRALVEHLTQHDAEEIAIDEILADVNEEDVSLLEQKEEEATVDEAESSPVVRYVNHIIQTALKEGASDIHIEPEEKSLKVRFRIDGVLFEMMNPPRGMHASLTSRIKIMANLDIAERRLPQDGRIRASVLGRKIDLRVSTITTAKGEKTVLRILDNRSINVPLQELGFHEDTLTIWRNQIAQPHGIILVTGPTGSGKTTTLYGSIQELDLRRLNVSTVEDPVEYNLVGITQIQTHEKIGMSFSNALRSLLRQDPDVIMLGEIRDMETATIAIQAAMTGHLVLSTLHTNDAPSSITRLINIGIEPFLVAGAVRSVLAQRLVRCICANCREEIPVTDEIAEFLTMHGITASTVVQGTGCAKCRETGYTGRAGLFEMLVMDDHLGDAVARNPTVTEFRRLCAERGMVSLREDGFRKVAEGLTTVAEVLRVTESTI